MHKMKVTFISKPVTSFNQESSDVESGAKSFVSELSCLI